MPMLDWMDKLNATFDNLDLKFPGGESSREAMANIVNVVMDVLNCEHENTVVVTHGNILSLLFNHFDENLVLNNGKDERILMCTY